MKITRPFNIITDMIYPRICPVCNEIMPLGCTDAHPGCMQRLTYADEPYCVRCGKPVEEDEEYCADCVRISHLYDEGRAALIYDEYASKSIYRFKYNKKREFAAFYAKVMYERLGRKIRSWEADAIVPVPVHRSRLKKRGYNQAQLIAKELSKRLGIPVLDTLVIRTGATGAQKELGAAARQNNLKKAFKVTRNVVELDTVLIVDDIYTTGATVDAMAGCLKGAGVNRVYFVTLCIGRGN